MKIEVTGYTPNEDSFTVNIDGTEFTARLQYDLDPNADAELAVSADGVTFAFIRELYSESVCNDIGLAINKHYEDWLADHPHE